MATKSVSQEADDILLASSMITLGARLQVLEAETSLSHAMTAWPVSTAKSAAARHRRACCLFRSTGS